VAEREGPSLETLLMLGASMKSPEDGKPTVDVPLTSVEIRALAMLSGARLRMLLQADSAEAAEMSRIYLGVTSKLILAGMRIDLLAASGGAEGEPT
jgi:hypothetical protein